MSEAFVAMMAIPSVPCRSVPTLNPRPSRRRGAVTAITFLLNRPAPGRGSHLPGTGLAKRFAAGRSPPPGHFGCTRTWMRADVTPILALVVRTVDEMAGRADEAAAR